MIRRVVLCIGVLTLPFPLYAGSVASNRHLNVSTTIDQCMVPNVVELFASDPPYLDAPSALTDCPSSGDPAWSTHCGRLIPSLRQFAKNGDPRAMLIRSAALEYMSRRGLTILRDSRHQLARALADLSVTGRRAYERFIALAGSRTDLADSIRLDAMIETRNLIQTFEPSIPWPAADDSTLLSSIDATVSRAYDALWAIRGPVAYRVEHRRELGWIAVSGEDDPPHRPVDVRSAPYPQYNMSVNVGGHIVDTRYAIISSAANRVGSTNTEFLPSDGSPNVIIGDVILFIHGHGSRLEEALSLAPELLERGRRDGRPLTIIAMDLPSSGYSSMLRHHDIAPPTDSDVNKGFPILEFFDKFVIAFVDNLERMQPGLKTQILGVIGGSLGGNMTLRLAEHDPHIPWLHSIVSWSPASSWPFGVSNLFAGAVRGKAYQHMEICNARNSAGECVDATGDRWNFFWGGKPGRMTTADTWYRNSWQPCKDLSIRTAYAEGQEIYNSRFRRWHWRVAYEQLIFSHQDNYLPPRPSVPRYSTINARVLLLAGQEDRPEIYKIYDYTLQLSGLMTMVEGEYWDLKNTGHSIHAERPKFLSAKIADFLFKTPPPALPNSIQSAIRGLLLSDYDDSGNKKVEDAAHSVIRNLILNP